MTSLMFGKYLQNIRRFFGLKAESKIEIMSSERFFINNFPDYTPENAQLLISDGKLQPSGYIVKNLNKKWTDTEKNLQDLDYRDYSVYTGTSGVAMLMLKRESENPDNVQAILQYLGLTRLKSQRISFLCGDMGPLTLAALIYWKLLKDIEYKDTLKRIRKLSKEVLNVKSDIPDEFLYGRAGYLYGILYLNKYIDPPPFDDAFVRQIIDVMLTRGASEAKNGRFKCPLMYQWHGKHYLGAAHGVTGIIYLFLQAKKYFSDQELQTLIKPTIDYLISLRYPSGNFPSSFGSESDKYVQWCHGAPGLLYMCSEGYKVFKDEKYLKVAKKCADIIWDRGILRKGYSICHGVSGNAYPFLELFQLTKDEKYLYRAVKFAEYCMDYKKENEGYSPDRPHSLFEGIAGPMYLLLDIQDPSNAKFPGFTL